MRQGFVRALDGLRLHWAGWGLEEIPEDHPTAILVHGFGEHLRRYDHVAQWLNAGGFAVVAADMRGHGQSEGQRGHVARYDEYLVDVGAAFDLAARLRPRGKRLLIGHSNGGLIALRYALSESGRRPDALVLSGALLELSMQVPALKEKLGNVLSRVAGATSMANDIDAALLSHDAQVVQDYIDDPLVHNQVTARWFTEMNAAREDAMTRAPSLSLPTLILHGGEDGVVSPKGSAKLAEVMEGDVTHIAYEGFYHEIFNEVERDRVFGDIAAWLRERELGFPADEES